jgi:alpha-amylase
MQNICTSTMPGDRSRGTTAMALVRDYSWQLAGVPFVGADARLKFDIFGDWSRNFGDGGDATADPAGAVIPVAAGAGRCTVTFDDRTLRYAATKE